MSVDNQSKNIDRRGESPKIPDVDVDELLRLESDPQFNQILQEESLNWLKTHNKESFGREFTGELDEQGYLVGKAQNSAWSAELWTNKARIIKLK